MAGVARRWEIPRAGSNIPTEEQIMGTMTKLLSSQGATMRSQIEELTGEKVVAVGQLKQGKTPSMTSMMTGTALFEVLRPRRSRSLPRGFAMAVTNSRVVAFSCVGVSDEYGENYHVVVRGKERGSWPREGVSFSGSSGSPDGTLNLYGERIRVCRPNMDGDPETDELIALLSRDPSSCQLGTA
jgi:hypothetical protein